MINLIREWWWKREVKALEREKALRHAYANQMIQEWRRAEWQRRSSGKRV
jgi:hypothetical protein